MATVDLGSSTCYLGDGTEVCAGEAKPYCTVIEVFQLEKKNKTYIDFMFRV
jgi:hypothetical protein